jgi:hypothetical protein
VLPVATETAALPILLRTSSAESPETRTTFWRLVWPEAMVTEDLGTFKNFAKKSMQVSADVSCIANIKISPQRHRDTEKSQILYLVFSASL